MKLELIEETRFGHYWPWYTLHVDGEEIYGSWSKHLVAEMYNKIEHFHRINKEKKFEKTIKNILQSSEIALSSQKTNNN